MKTEKRQFIKTALILWVLCLIGKMSLFPYIVAQKIVIDISWQDYLKTFFIDAIVYAVIIIIGLKCAQKISLSARVDQDIKNVTLVWLFKMVSIGVMTGVVLLFLEKIVFAFPYQGIAEHNFHWQWQGLLASLYGAINEEVILRLFLMSFIAWGLIKLFKKTSRNSLFIISIVLSSLIFGVLHLPAAAKLWSLTPFIVCRILILNGLAGVVFGFLYYRHNLLAAMIAHFSADVILHGMGV